MGLFGLGIASLSTAAAEVAALSSTIDRISQESVAYLSGDHGQFTLRDSAHKQASDTQSIIIGGVTYYYNPGSDTAIANLVKVGSAALTTVGATADNYVFTDGTNYYIYDTSKLAKSGITYTDGTESDHDVAQTQTDGTIKYYKISHSAPSKYTVGDRTIVLGADERNYYTGFSDSKKNEGGALTITSDATDITADIYSNTNNGDYPSSGGILHDGGAVNNITADFYNILHNMTALPCVTMQVM